MFIKLMNLIIFFFLETVGKLNLKKNFQVVDMASHEPKCYMNFVMLLQLALYTINSNSGVSMDILVSV